jgi:hypothetical protein
MLRTPPYAIYSLCKLKTWYRGAMETRLALAYGLMFILALLVTLAVTARVYITRRRRRIRRGGSDRIDLTRG